MRLYTLVVWQDRGPRITHHWTGETKDSDAAYNHFKKLLPEDLRPYLDDAMYYGKEKCGNGKVLLFTSWGLD